VGSSPKLLRFCLLLALICSLLAGLNLILGMSEFGGYDLSPVIDAAWRIDLGQIPNVSYICTLPPSLYLPTDWAFKLFGVRWVSLLYAEDILYLILCFLGLRLCWILRTYRPDGKIVSLMWMYAGIQSILLLSVNHIYHSTTSAGVDAFAILAAYVLLSSTRNHHRWESTAYLAIGFMILLASKPNTTWPAVLFCIVCLLLNRPSAKFGLLALGAAILTDTLVLSASKISVLEVLKAYTEVKGRALPRMFLVGIYPDGSQVGAACVTLTYLLLAIPVWEMLNAVWRNRAGLRRSPAELLFVFAGIVSVIGLGTNWEHKLIDTTSFLTGAAIAATMHTNQYMSVLRPLKWTVALFVLFAAVMGVERTHMQTVGPWAGNAYGPKVAIHDHFFGDFTARQAFADLLHETDSVVSQSRGKRIFFGPRMEFLYARESIVSPLHLPVWWHPGSSYAVSHEAIVDKAWDDDHFDVLIFAKHDRTRFPARLLQEIQTRYQPDLRWKSIDVFERIDSPISQIPPRLP
jgi:hypothetical protein